jgi:putative transposase
LYKAFRYRLYPNQEQEVLLSKHFGHCRFLWSLALETKTNAYLSAKVNYSRFDLQKQLVELKKECEWLKEVNSQSLQSVLHNLDLAYKKFFKGSGFPKFKSKHDKQSFHIPQNVKVENGSLVIPKFKKKGIKIKLHRPLEGTIKSATISRTSTGKYFVSILCDTGEDCKPKSKVKKETAVGIDLGIKDFAVTSDGEVIKNPKFLRNNIDRLKVLQRRASKKKKGSNNRKKANKRVALLHEKIKNQRQDFLHKISSRLVSENQTICLENLGVSNMMKNHCLAQSISDVSWSEFNRMIEYKAEWYGVNILRIGRFAPSSKTCECGVINKDLKLSDRVWECKSCGQVNERDYLAARNIKKFALYKENSGQELSVEPVEMSTLVESMKQEAQPIAFGVGG